MALDLSQYVSSAKSLILCLFYFVYLSYCTLSYLYLPDPLSISNRRRDAEEKETDDDYKTEEQFVDALSQRLASLTPTPPSQDIHFTNEAQISGALQQLQSESPITTTFCKTLDYQCQQYNTILADHDGNVKLFKEAQFIRLMLIAVVIWNFTRDNCDGIGTDAARRVQEWCKACVTQNRLTGIKEDEEFQLLSKIDKCYMTEDRFNKLVMMGRYSKKLLSFFNHDFFDNIDPFMYVALRYKFLTRRLIGTLLRLEGNRRTLTRKASDARILKKFPNVTWKTEDTQLKIDYFKFVYSEHNRMLTENKAARKAAESKKKKKKKEKKKKKKGQKEKKKKTEKQKKRRRDENHNHKDSSPSKRRRTNPINGNDNAKDRLRQSNTSDASRVVDISESDKDEEEEHSRRIRKKKANITGSSSKPRRRSLRLANARQAANKSSSTNSHRDKEEMGEDGDDSDEDDLKDPEDNDGTNDPKKKTRERRGADPNSIKIIFIRNSQRNKYQSESDRVYFKSIISDEMFRVKMGTDRDSNHFESKIWIAAWIQGKIRADVLKGGEREITTAWLHSKKLDTPNYCGYLLSQHILEKPIHFPLEETEQQEGNAGVTRCEEKSKGNVGVTRCEEKQGMEIIANSDLSLLLSHQTKENPSLKIDFYHIAVSPEIMAQYLYKMKTFEYRSSTFLHADPSGDTASFR